MLAVSAFVASWLLAPAVPATPTGAIVGWVVDQTGMPIAGTRVLARLESGGENYQASTDGEGRFRLGPLAPGAYLVKVTAPRRPDFVQRAVAVGLWRPTEMNVVMNEPCGGTGYVPPYPPSRIVVCGNPPPAAADPAPCPAEPALTVAGVGRRATRATLAGGRLVGDVRGVSVDLTVSAVEIRGHVAGEPLWLWMHGREAEGHLGGEALGFTLNETPGGYLLQGAAGGRLLRLERSFGTLAWLPGCEEPLVPLPREQAGVTRYQGTCESGQRLRVELPDGWETLPPLPRHILLAILLTEREDLDRGRGVLPLVAEAR